MKWRVRNTGITVFTFWQQYQIMVVYWCDNNYDHMNSEHYQFVLHDGLMFHQTVDLHQLSLMHGSWYHIDNWPKFWDFTTFPQSKGLANQGLDCLECAYWAQCWACDYQPDWPFGLAFVRFGSAFVRFLLVFVSNVSTLVSCSWQHSTL